MIAAAVHGNIADFALRPRRSRHSWRQPSLVTLANHKYCCIELHWIIIFQTNYIQKIQIHAESVKETSIKLHQKVWSQFTVRNHGLPKGLLAYLSRKTKTQQLPVIACTESAMCFNALLHWLLVLLTAVLRLYADYVALHTCDAGPYTCLWLSKMLSVFRSPCNYVFSFSRLHTELSHQ